MRLTPTTLLKHEMSATTPAADTLSGINNRYLKIDFITKAIEFNVDAADITMLFVKHAGSNFNPKSIQLGFNVIRSETQGIKLGVGLVVGVTLETEQ